MIEKLPLQIIPIENDGYHPIVDCLVNGQPIRMLVDTGASKTVFDEEKLGLIMDKADFQSNDKLSTGLGTSSMEGKLAVLEEICFGNIRLKGIEVAVLDLFHVNESYQKLSIPVIHGVMGGDLLVMLKATIDYENSRLILVRKDH